MASYLEADSVRQIPGVGEVAQTALEKLGIRTIADLLRWYPRQYIDGSKPIPIAELRTGDLSVIKVTIDSVHQRRTKTNNLKMVEAEVTDMTGDLTIRWFNQPFLEQKLQPGSEWIFIGIADRFQGKLTMLSPLIEEKASILSVYAQTKGVTSKMFRGFIEWALRATTISEDGLPPIVHQRQALLSRAEVLQRIHQPTHIEEVAAAREQIAFEEVFWFFLQLLSGRTKQLQEKGIIIPAEVDFLQEVTHALPFELTPGQKRAIWDIAQEMQSGVPMTRLLNGDVGSGKTVVAGVAAALVSKAGLQSIILVPTEILARQHTVSLDKLLAGAGLKVALWTAAQKDEIQEADIVVGTHAVLQEGFSLPRLGFVVIDEQHRFGVKQRQWLRSAQDTAPHVLSMTATPIPRTLALTLYGNISISVLKDKPKDRLPVITQLISARDRQAMHRRIVMEIQNGKQIFVVCPLIDEKKKEKSAEEGPSLQLFSTDELEAKEKKTVVAVAEKLREEHPEYGVIEVIHGKMKPDQKKQIMERMAAGEIQVLVATSVIEVGVDVPNATVMVIEGAERFGLAQLHQFRGRVGRGADQAYCFLCPDLRSQAIIERLSVLVETSSGFEVAEKDLELRGPGELVGEAQSGLPDFRMASLTDIAFLQRVREEVETFMRENPDSVDEYSGKDYVTFMGGIE
jgi:ATP-dependent DNA helicase RecG